MKEISERREGKKDKNKTVERFERDRDNPRNCGIRNAMR